MPLHWKFSGAAHNIGNLRYETTKEILAVFHNASTFDYHFIINLLAKEFDGQLEGLGENAKNVLLFQYQLAKNLIIVKQSHTN